MSKVDEIIKKYQIVDGDFNDLDKFNFEGVYIIYDKETNDVIYVGSSYSRMIKERLEQYKQKNNTGNTLLHAICKKDFLVDKVKNITDTHKKLAIDKILLYKIKAIPHKDLEYQIIRDARPFYNTAGNLIDYNDD